MKIIFLGTPDFAVPSLEILLNHGYDLVGVITAPDKPAGRGLQLQESAVKKFATERGLKVLQPEKLKNPDFLAELKSLQADLQIVIAFRMLPIEVWNMPPMGTFNLHASLLPKYRGAAPINRAIMNGEVETGITTFFLKHEIDTGNIILQEKVPIAPDMNAGQLYEILMNKGASLVLETVKLIEKDNYTLSEQASSENLPHAPKIFKEDCRINWNNSVDHIYNQVRGLSPYPVAFTQLGGETLKIYRAGKIKSQPQTEPGTYETDKKTYFRFACADGYLDVMEMQAAGRKKMSVKEFLMGFRS